MFSDERINKVSGKVYRNGIIIATIISFCYLILKYLTIAKQGNFSLTYVVSEIFIVLGGIVILLFGELRLMDQEKDERYYIDKYSFYIKAAKYFLTISLFGFAIAIPFEFSKPVETMPLNILLIYLEIIGLIYFSYYFKINKIFFNYTFIDETGWDYYKKVFANILKLLLLLLFIYAISLVLCFIIYAGSQNMIAVLLIILIAFIFSFISLGIIYLFISWVEKVSFDEENIKRRFSVASLIIGACVILLFVIASSMEMKNFILISNGLNSTDKPIGQLIANNLIKKKYVIFYYRAIYGLLITYLLINLRNKKTCICGIKIMLISIVASIIYELIFTNVANIINLTKDITLSLSTISNYIVLFISIIEIIGIFILIIGLIKEDKKSKSIIIFPIISILFGIVSSILRQNFLSLDSWAYLNFTVSVLIKITFIIIFIFIKDTDHLNEITYE